ncbi:MAG: CoA transferase [Proteobacteria bacterium]|nr:CoA transferase [Pseudomonadota bacterium]MDA1299331.1 CoA transferase [Pseudomonadota bacterium]
MDDLLFSGLKVLDVSTVIAAPAAAMILADFGADVIKIEPPGDGDMLRAIRDVPQDNEATADYMWQMDGRNKRGMVLNLKRPEGKEILHRLVAACDVYVTNQPYSVRDSLGLNYEQLKPINPRMIYASLTAYGEKGPERSRKGFDQLAYWARSGLMDLMRGEGAPPVQGLSGMGDHPTGVALYAGIVTALLRREKTGEGAMVHTSLLANGLWSNASITQGSIAGGDTARFREGRKAPPSMMRVYQCSDGRWLQLNMVRNYGLIGALLRALGAAHLLDDERFCDAREVMRNRVALGDEIAPILASKPSAEWMTIFDEIDLPVNLVATIEEKAVDVQVLENRMAMPPNDPEMGVPLLLNHPIQVTSVPHAPHRRPPQSGEHSAEILAELGYSTDQISALRDQGVI